MINTARNTDPQALRLARAQVIRDLFEPWTYRKLEARTGISRTAIAARWTGQTELSIADVEVLAPVIRMTPAELFAELMNAQPGQNPQDDLTARRDNKRSRPLSESKQTTLAPVTRIQDRRNVA